MSAAAHAAFRRALGRGSLAHALAAAHDLPVVSLADALSLVLLAAEKDQGTFERAAARWLARYVAELRRVDLAEAGLVHAALVQLGAADPRAGVLALLSLAELRGLREVTAVLRTRLG